MISLILASGSPRRKELLCQIGASFEVVPSTFEEVVQGSPQEIVTCNALGKAREVAQRVGKGWVLGADTVVVHDGQVLGKPVDRADADGMLRQLSDDWHEVLTALALVNGETGASLVDLVTTRVHMRALTDEEIDVYLDSDEPYDKAGAYAIQGRAATFVDCIEGCYYNVVGLPLSRLVELWHQLG
ncbi:MAG: Maf family protein [Bacillota bacterium]|jgi:septum formation protein